MHVVLRAASSDPRIPILKDVFSEHVDSYLTEYGKITTDELRKTFAVTVETVGDPDPSLRQDSVLIEYNAGWKGTLSEAAVLYATALCFSDPRLRFRSAGIVSIDTLTGFYLTPTNG